MHLQVLSGVPGMNEGTHEWINMCIIYVVFPLGVHYQDDHNSLLSWLFADNGYREKFANVLQN